MHLTGRQKRCVYGLARGSLRVVLIFARISSGHTPIAEYVRSFEYEAQGDSSQFSDPRPNPESSDTDEETESETESEHDDDAASDDQENLESGHEPLTSTEQPTAMREAIERSIAKQDQDEEGSEGDAEMEDGESDDDDSEDEEEPCVRGFPPSPLQTLTCPAQDHSSTSVSVRQQQRS